MVAAINQVECAFAPHVQGIFDPYRYKVMYGGRGGVKSWTAARALLIQGAQEPLRILCTREVQKSIKDSVHTLLKDQINRLGLDAFYQVFKNEIRGRNGTTFVFTGLSTLTADSIKSYEGVDRVWVEEAATVTQRSWDILVPTIRKEGSEIWVTFNPELDTDETWVRFVENTPENTWIQECSYDSNPWFPSVLEQERREFLKAVEIGSREQDEYDNIWEGQCKASVAGALYSKQVAQMLKENRYTETVGHDPSLFTHTVWDLGYNGMAIGFVQRAASAVRLIDHLNLVGETYENCVKAIRKKVTEHGYRIAIDGKTGGKAWLPHDGKQTRPDKGKSPIRQLNDLGLVADEDGVPDLGIDKRIEAGRAMFPRFWINKSCVDFFNSIRRYAKKISKETGQMAGIKKDGNDHDGDMYTYIAVIENELINESREFKPLVYNRKGIV